MDQFVDGFVIPVPKTRLDDYRKMAAQASAVWKEYGALEYRECVLEDPECSEMVSFPRLAGAGPDETVVLAYITYRSRAHRDEVNAKVMADARLQEMCDPANPPFDFKRMAYGGFQTIVYA